MIKKFTYCLILLLLPPLVLLAQTATITGSVKTADGKPAFVLKIKSDDGQVSHEILLSEQAGFAIAGLVQIASSTPEINQQGEFENSSS